VRVFAYVLAVALVLAACGSDGGGDEEASSSAPASTSAAVPTATALPVTDPTEVFGAYPVAQLGNVAEGFAEMEAEGCLTAAAPYEPCWANMSVISGWERMAADIEMEWFDPGDIDHSGLVEGDYADLAEDTIQTLRDLDAMAEQAVEVSCNSTCDFSFASAMVVDEVVPLLDRWADLGVIGSDIDAYVADQLDEFG
jgi:hypothetical protein